MPLGIPRETEPTGHAKIGNCPTVIEETQDYVKPFHFSETIIRRHYIFYIQETYNE